MFTSQAIGERTKERHREDSTLYCREVIILLAFEKYFKGKKWWCDNRKLVYGLCDPKRNFVVVASES